MIIKFENQLPKIVEEKMKKDLIQYEKSHGIDINYKKFCLLLSIENDEVIGVLNGYTAFSEIYIDDLWINTNQRKKGYGKKLIQELENHFKEKGYNNINLVTNQFQAPEFYKKCGFEIEFIRNNKKNPKLTKIFFIKYFDN